VLNTQIEGGFIKLGHLGQIVLFSALPIALIFLFALQAQDHFSEAFITGLFICLAALTVPHMVLVDGLRKH
jgi:glucan phosphoethanolaminetransferase (alkaline phosphatase superfamily)